MGYFLLGEGDFDLYFSQTSSFSTQKFKDLNRNSRHSCKIDQHINNYEIIVQIIPFIVQIYPILVIN